MHVHLPTRDLRHHGHGRPRRPERMHHLATARLILDQPVKGRGFRLDDGPLTVRAPCNYSGTVSASLPLHCSGRDLVALGLTLGRHHARPQLLHRGRMSPKRKPRPLVHIRAPAPARRVERAVALHRHKWIRKAHEGEDDGSDERHTAEDEADGAADKGAVRGGWESGLAGREWRGAHWL